MTARIAGLLYLILIPVSVFGIMYVPADILAHEMLFRLSIASALVAQLINIFVLFLLYKLLKPVNAEYAKLMVVLFLIGVPVALCSELSRFAVLLILHSSDQSHTLVPLFLDLHKQGIYVAQIFWGLWLLPLGYLVYKSRFLPKIIGVLLMIGCFGYVIDSFVFFLFPQFGFTFSTYTFIGEPLLALWLLIKGVSVES